MKAMPDYAGNNLTSAREISFATGSQTFSDRVDTFDTDDYYRINLSGRSSLNLAINGLSANANLQLLDRNGNTLRSSTNSAGITESINQILDADVYYIRIYQDSSSASTDYTLNLTLQNSPKTDIFWRDYSTGTNAVWFMGDTDNATIIGSTYLPSVATNWRVEDIADFNGDNRPDLLWRDYSSGTNAVWFMGGTNNATIIGSTYLPSVATNWQIESTADFNGDNRPDLLWRDYSTGTNAVWFMGGTNNATIIGSTYLPTVAINWRIESTADFNGDNRPDLLWRDYSTGTNAVWFMGGTNNATIIGSTYLPSVAINWRIESTADFNGDNRPDLFWRDYSSGTNTVWFMGGTNNATIIGAAALPTVATNWQALSYTRYEEPIPIDLAGNTTNTAFNVGTLSGSGVFSDRIDSADPNDYYQFTLASASNISLSLNNLSANADIQLLSSNGTVLQGSYSNSSSAESISTTLSAGTYYALVYQASGSTTYSLSLSATAAQIYKYNFTYYYNGSNSSADYYTGYVYDYAGKYSVNTFYNPNTASNQAGYDGRYYITGSSLVTGTANPGYVYASTYYDIDSSGASYAAYYGNYGSSTASGYNGLGSEYDYVYDASRGAYDDFGSDRLEVDSLPVVTLTATDPNAAETLSGQTANPGQFTFTRTGNNASVLTVYYTTGGSATNGSDYTNLPTSVTFQAGQSSVALPINIFDDSLVEGNETVVLTLNANSAYTLGAATAGTVTIADNDLPVVTLTASDANAAETLSGQTANPGQFTFTRTGSNTSALTIYYTTGGSATNGSDYSSLATSVTFQAGQSSVALPISIFDDSLFEGTETVVLTLNANSAYTLGSAIAGTVTIADNDLPIITITANDANAAETLSGQTANPGQFTVTRTGSTATALTVNYGVGGTATSGSDYSGVTTSVTIAAGQSSAVISINVLDDSLVEGNETVNFVLLANSAYALGSNTSATVTIADNDAVYKYGFTYYYNGSTASADYYTGYIYANSGTYTVGSYFDYTSSTNQAGYNGKYYINNSSIAGSNSDVGKVYVSTYYDVDSSGNSYGAYFALSGSASGSNGLGTESDYIYDGSTYRGFGSDRDEADVPRGTVTVTAPNGGNVLRPGASQTITWNDNLSENVKIDLYKGGTFYSTIATSVISNGSYTWTLPTNLSNGNDYSIRITSVNNSSLFDSSDTTFSVKADLKKFSFYYNFNPQSYTQADSYIGSVIAPDWMYALNGTYDPFTVITEAGLNGKYLVSQVDDYNDDLTAEAGRVFVNDYIDRDNGSEKHFTPYKYSQGVQPSGTNYLGSELDYIDASQSVTSKFGQDYYEADPVASFVSISNLVFSGKEGDTGTFNVSLNQAITSDVTLTFNAGKFLTIDADGIVSDGTQNIITFTSTNWNQSRTVWFIAEDDDTSANRSSGNTIGYTLSGGLSSSGSYDIGTITNTYAPDYSRFNIDLDFRNDTQNFWTSARRTVAQRAANDWANVVANELNGVPFSNQSLGMIGINGLEAFTFTTNRYIDDFVIFVGSYNGGDKAAGWGGSYSELGGWTASEPLPRGGKFTVNAQEAATYSDAALYSVFCHEIGHALGLLGQDKTSADLIDKATPQTAVFKGEYSRIANGGSYIPLQSQDGLNPVTGEYDYSHPANRVYSMMSYGYTYQLSAPTSIDFALLADAGYRVKGVNA